MINKIGVVLVTFNRIETLKKAIFAIQNQTFSPSYICVVDNGSRQEIIDQYTQFTGVDWLMLEENVGYGAGLNYGCKKLIEKHPDISFIWMMDDDSYPSERAFETLISARGKIGRPCMIGFTGLIEKYFLGRKKIEDLSVKDREGRHIMNNMFTVDMLLVDCTLLDVSVLQEVGPPLDDLFMMSEDIEFTYRIRKHNFPLYLFNDRDIIEREHLGGGKSSLKSTIWRGYYHSRNNLRILKLNYTLIDGMLYFIRQMKFIIAAVFLPFPLSRIKYRLLGILHGIRDIKGKTVDPEYFK